MGFDELEKLGYKKLKDLIFEIDVNDGCFVFCFWVYLPKSTPFPCTILHQLPPGNPFLGLSENKLLNVSPCFLLDKEGADMSRVGPCVIRGMEFPLERWVHLGCEVSSNVIRIHLDGKVVGEHLLDFSKVKETKETLFQRLVKVTLSGMRDGSGSLNGYIYNSEILPLTSSVKGHHLKDSPLKLYVDRGSASDIKLERSGIWNIVGGKVSCRKMFSLDILLLDAFGQDVDKDLKVVASLVYDEDQSPVENSEDDEAPLLAVCDGREFPSGDKPIKLAKGRASFTMKISQLSSNCGNKLFRIKFNVPEMRNVSFLEAFTSPIRCILSMPDTKLAMISWKKLPSGVHLFNGSNLPQCNAGLQLELPQKPVSEVRPNPPSKRVKFGLDAPLPMADTSERPSNEACNSYRVPENKSAIGTSLDSIQQNYGGIDNSASDSESAGARDSELKNMSRNRELLSDLTIFKYCLGGLSERLLLLKEISLSVSELDILEFAEKVSFFSGCPHHRHQVMIAKRLLEEGEKVWKLISQNSDRVHWDNVVFEIEEQFMRVACCSMRSLTQQDFNFLRRISKAQDYLTKDSFDNMWRWLYPVAFTISRQEINSLWASTSPKWIEGFVTKEEVEYALQSPMGISEPGTFILRFPTTRSWPHPDAGSLVASYVGKDFSLHHRQLSLDYSSGMFEKDPKPLQELLLSQPEFSRVGRMSRSNLAV